jgi:hypothetical protein
MKADKPANAEITFDAYGSKINIFQTLAKYSLPIPSPLLKILFCHKASRKSLWFYPSSSISPPSFLHDVGFHYSDC